MTHPNTSNIDGALSDERLAELLDKCEGAGDVGIADWQYKEASVTFGTMRSILTELQSRRRSPSAVEVKGLEWKNYDGRSTEYADTILGAYSVWEGHFRRPNDYGGTAANDPKAAAQEDFERQILSCISLPQPNQIENGGEAVAWRFRAKGARGPWSLRYERPQDAAQVLDIQPLYTHPPELTIDEAMVERAMRAFYHDADRVLRPTDEDDKDDLRRWTADMRAALTAAFKGGE